MRRHELQGLDTYTNVCQRAGSGLKASAAVALLRGGRQPARLFNDLRLGVRYKSLSPAASPLGYHASSRPYLVLPLPPASVASATPYCISVDLSLLEVVVTCRRAA